jgi:hypothetical protein
VLVPRVTGDRYAWRFANNRGLTGQPLAVIRPAKAHDVRCTDHTTSFIVPRSSCGKRGTTSAPLRFLSFEPQQQLQQEHQSTTTFIAVRSQHSNMAQHYSTQHSTKQHDMIQHEALQVETERYNEKYGRLSAYCILLSLYFGLLPDSRLFLPKKAPPMPFPALFTPLNKP